MILINAMGLFNLFPTKPQAKRQESFATPDAYWTLAAEQLIAALHTTNNGIQQADAESRIKQYGPNVMKVAIRPSPSNQDHAVSRELGVLPIPVG